MKIDLTLTKEDYLEVVEDILTNTVEGKKQVWTVRVFLLFLTLIVSASLYFIFNGILYATIGLVVGLGTIAVHSRRDLVKRYRKEIDRPINRSRFGPISYRIEDTGIWKEVGGDKQFVTWESIGELRKTIKFIWFKAAGNLIFIFPRRGFASEEDFSKLHSTILGNLKK